MKLEKEEIVTRFQAIQDSICCELEETDGSALFKTDIWQRPEGGGGRSKTMTDGSKIDKGAVLFSAVFGQMPKAAQATVAAAEGTFFATGVSIVIHPKNPWSPIIHLNIRYFEAENGQKWWFGGGIDLTPHYVERNDARFFHQKLRAVCDLFEPDFYEKAKATADDYFFLPHRNETRGVGGIFFDHQNEATTSRTQRDIFEFVASVGENFAPIYKDLLERNAGRAFGERQRKWQALRRGRYVEFNLVWDRGTKFGLETNGRTESILASMPPEANWVYGFEPENDSHEAATLAALKKNVNWLA